VIPPSTLHSSLRCSGFPFYPFFFQLRDDERRHSLCSCKHFLWAHQEPNGVPTLVRRVTPRKGCPSFFSPPVRPCPSLKSGSPTNTRFPDPIGSLLGRDDPLFLVICTLPSSRFLSSSQPPFFNSSPRSSNFLRCFFLTKRNQSSFSRFLIN